MKRLISRVLLISDPHCMVIAPKKQKGQIIKGIDRIIEGWLIRRWKKRNNPTFFKFLRNARFDTPYERVIVLGDLLECVWNERGILVSEDLKGISIIKFALDSNLPVTGKKHFVVGDHEGGYDLPLKLDPQGGIRPKSLSNFKNALDNLYETWQIGNFHFIKLSSSLFSQTFNHLEEDEKCKMELLKRQQLHFLTVSLLNVPNSAKLFVFFHDPDAIELIDKLPGSHKIAKIFCGHMHEEKTLKSYVRLGKMANSFLGRALFYALGLVVNRLGRARRVVRWAKGNLYRASLFKKYNLEIVPGICGMLGSGAGYKILNLYKDGTFEVTTH